MTTKPDKRCPWCRSEPVSSLAGSGSAWFGCANTLCPVKPCTTGATDDTARTTWNAMRTLQGSMTDEELGRMAMDAIIEGGMIHADPEEPHVLIWNGNAPEQLGAALHHEARAAWNAMRTEAGDE